jgi:hypothetical protein
MRKFCRALLGAMAKLLIRRRLRICTSNCIFLKKMTLRPFSVTCLTEFDKIYRWLASLESDVSLQSDRGLAGNGQEGKIEKCMRGSRLKEKKKGSMAVTGQ